MQNVQRTRPNELAITVVTYEEQLRGWLNYIRRASDQAQLIVGYQKLKESLNFFCDKQVLEFTEAVATEYSYLQQQKLRIGTQDLRIAAIVLSVDGVIVTRNRRDFGQVPGLQIEDWSL
ncbi:type II toxin-antitoxin system VapC family toxin [Alkalinema sp. FACHB-956]|uniref:type II toxin-antitoxin system VapC family toxin n=1 Tax=Alkalinema sp. FACHB-956 TaxID=2692768 RepID=UPI0018EFF5EA